MSEITLPINLNPLMLEWGLGIEPTPESLLKYLCPLDISSDLSALKKRHDDISVYDGNLPIFFEEPYLKENLLEPLRQAKINYILGNYLGSIALSAVVAEKLAILRYIMSNPSKTKIKNFQRHCRQETRIQMLTKERLIDESTASNFIYIRKARNPYLHHWNTPRQLSAEKAAKAYAAAVRVFAAVIVVEFANGKLVLQPHFLEYLAKQGII